MFKWVFGLALVMTAPFSQAALINGDFSDLTDLVGWSSIGNVTEQPDGIVDDRAILSTASGSTSFASINSALGIDIQALTDTATGSASNNASNASVMYQSFTVAGVGDLSFDWNFLTNEPTFLYNPDFAFYVLVNAITLDVVPIVSAGGESGFSSSTGFATETITGLASGSYLLGFGVVNANNSSRDSALLVDNVVLSDVVPTVPVPATAALLAVGMMGLRRRVVPKR